MLLVSARRPSLDVLLRWRVVQCWIKERGNTINGEFNCLEFDFAKCWINLLI